jgi:hypothetical protein
MVLPIFLLSTAAAALAEHLAGGRRRRSSVAEQYGSEDLLFPLDSDVRVVTSPFGWRMHPVYKERRLHEGVDLRAKEGTPVLAPADGTVAYTTSSGACGWGVCIDHTPTLRSLFCHLSRKDVSEGQQVKAGQVIGLSGGRRGHPGAGTSTAPHLHFAVHTRPTPTGQWRPVDPMPLVAQGTPDSPPIAEEASPEEETWFDSLMAFIWGSDEPAAPQATWDLAPGARGYLLGTDGTQYSPGAVPAGQYQLVLSTGTRTSVTLEADQSYRASSVGRMFQVR